MEMAEAMQIGIENLKCGGCEKSILKGLATMSEISDVVVDREHKLVSFSGDQSVRNAVVNKLRSMGYPEKDSLSGIDAGLANAKSFVSCAIGRVS
ncbi:MAG: heavy-metal-associated domain-containing protein [Burkholderiaceae bacterium]|jgi:copper chaperone|nr:heavy-metal-associated domain-containing protein [Burkholderiaceae bacterium]MDP5116585.1 heavy-metal-associated domain-containing protein [Burkholderiaceae bacterium]|tara:strand:- start:1501 stop:1785 length:285 start_codon:yes stop_codon:yes gene_type:complete